MIALSEPMEKQPEDARANVARTAQLTAWVRALGRLTTDGRANGDDLAHAFVLPPQRHLLRVPRFSRWLVERLAPGAFGYFNARTQCFDEALLKEADRIEQVVLLGAGFDSRPMRFARELRHARVFEVDMPEVLRIRAERSAGMVTPSNAIAVAIDFARDDLGSVLTAHGYTSDARTLFLWEGVTYYLPLSAVEAALAFMSAHSAPGSSVVFDYVTQAFFDGDYSGYGTERLAASWRRMGNVNRSCVRDVHALLRPHGFNVRSELDADALEQKYLSSLPGPRARPWGSMRIVHAERA